jgi:ADP-dependent NAD(P)H-hydrate dehydratase / NAD(P)H-hydrate epimerase
LSESNCMIFPYTGKVATAEQMREFDRRAAEEFGVPSIVLMENAGRHVAKTVMDAYGPVTGRRITVVAGRGNNGGDGFVAARHLRDAGADVEVLLLADPSDVKGDAKINLDILLKSKQPVGSNPSLSEMESILVHSHVIIDAIFGTGLRDEIKGPAADAIHAMNASARPVVAVDLPSGLDADTGKVWGVCVKADFTVTFALPKIGLYTYPGAAYAGKIVVVEIGIPHELYSDINVELPSDAWVASRLPERFPEAHKGTFGTTLVIAGSSGFTGAAALASEAALRSGAGLSEVAVPASLQDIMATKLTEVMTRGLSETDARSVSDKALQPALDLSEKATSIVLGCGLSTHPETCRFVQEFVKAVRKPMVVDADGINCLAEDIQVLEGIHGDLILTPHPGEMSRLLGTNTVTVQSNRMDAAKEAASRFHSIVVLKGARTLIADPSGRVFINPTGNVGMATGGTGDVLAGTIGGLLAQGMSPLDAAVCGTYIHGRAGDIAADALGTAGMIAGDVLRALPEALKRLYTIRCV